MTLKETIGEKRHIRAGDCELLVYFWIDCVGKILELRKMIPFATEFPIKSSKNRADFIAEVIAWLRGTSYSTVLNAGSHQALEQENVSLRSMAGEELHLREIKGSSDGSAVGFRHDFPDSEGRLWRTEGVLRRAAAEPEQDLLRIRTQCLARNPGARLDSPRKPYLIKALLKNGWGGLDATLPVSDQPVWLESSNAGLNAARSITFGDATNFLPIVYVSATGNGSWILSNTEIRKLAYDLGGIAHVVVEPDRGFSFLLRDESAGANVYGGTVGLCVPGHGIVRRYYLGWQISDLRDLAVAIQQGATNVRTQLPTSGWDWTDLQEKALRLQRDAYKGALSAAESEALFQDYVKQLEDLQAENRQLIERIAKIPLSGGVESEGGEFSNANLVGIIGPEVYAGEIIDRLRLATEITLSKADQIGLDTRSKVILERFLHRIPCSPARRELSEDISRAAKDPKRVARDITSLLSRHGYQEKSDNKHIRLEAKVGYEGLDSITLPKTPSENRGLQNLCKQIERTLGINKLPD